MERKMIARIREDGWGFAELTIDNGHAATHWRISKDEAAEALPTLVNDGFRIEDPDHLLDVWGILSEHHVSQSAMNADAAGVRGRGYVGRAVRRWDDEQFANAEIAAFPEW